MAKKFDWQAWRKQAVIWHEWLDHGTRPGVVSPTASTRDVRDLLDSRDAAVKALQDIITLNPRPIKPYGKAVVEIAKTGLAASKL